MKKNDQAQWPPWAAVGLALLGAAAVFCVRLVAENVPTPDASSIPGTPRGKPAIHTYSPPPAHLLDPGHEAEFARWMEDHPADVMHYIDTLDDRKEAMKLAAVFVHAVQGPHYDLLLSWLTRQKDEKLATVIFRNMIQRLIRENPDECIAISFALGNTYDSWIARDEFFFALPLEKRVQLVNQQSTEERAFLLSRRGTGFAERAPELCLNLIKDLPPSAERGEALSKLLKAWTAGANVYHLADPLAAVNGLMKIEDPKLRREGLKIAAFEWSQAHPDIASGWIAKQPVGADRDAAIEGLVNRLASADLKAAVDWAEAISDEALRISTLDRLEKMPPTKTWKSK